MKEPLLPQAELRLAGGAGPKTALLGNAEMLTESPGASCKGCWGLWLGVLAEQTGSGTSEARRLPESEAKISSPSAFQRIRPGLPEAGVQGAGEGRQGVGLCIKILPRKGQLLPSTGPAGLPGPPFPGHPSVSPCSLPRPSSGWGGLRSPKPHPLAALLFPGKGVGEAPTEPLSSQEVLQGGISTAAPRPWVQV